MNDVEFVPWALQVGLRWAGFRTVRRQVIRRHRARVEELGLNALDAYES